MGVFIDKLINKHNTDFLIEVFRILNSQPITASNIPVIVYGPATQGKLKFCENIQHFNFVSYKDTKNT